MERRGPEPKKHEYASAPVRTVRSFPGVGMSAGPEPAPRGPSDPTAPNPTLNPVKLKSVNAGDLLIPSVQAVAPARASDGRPGFGARERV